MHVISPYTFKTLCYTRPASTVLLIISGPTTPATMNKAGKDNKANQQNPNHSASGPGRPAGYSGAGTKADLDNHAKQLNKNNDGK